MAGDHGAESLADMVRSYLDDDEGALMPHDSDAEVRANRWCYGIPAEPVDVADAVAALHFVADGLRHRLAGHAGPGTFYAWYDEQAGQLRCSLTSSPPDRLPFPRWPLVLRYDDQPGRSAGHVRRTTSRDP